ncbi:MAG: hypothetical protein V1794_10410 [Candidatus Glassbacteria bacterium]
MSTIAIIIDNSFFGRRLGEFARECVFVRFCRAVRQLAGDILDNSLAAGFLRDRLFPHFLVEDYLGRDSTLLVKTFGQSLVYRLVDKVISSVLEMTRALAAAVFRPRGLVLSLLAGLGTAVARGGRKRSIAVIVLLYAAAYYTLRWILLRLFPEADVYSSWSAGIILAVLFAVLLFLTAGSSDRADR